jgi:hypothetical protein
MRTIFRSFCVSALLLIAGNSAHAHEIKVLASCLMLPQAGEKATVFLSWGHRLPVDGLVDGKSIERYEAIGPSGIAQRLKLDNLSLQANSVEIKRFADHSPTLAARIGRPSMARLTPP